MYAAYLNVGNKVDILKPDEIECVAGIIEIKELRRATTHRHSSTHLCALRWLAKTILVLEMYVFHFFTHFSQVRWTEMFPCIIAKAQTVEVLSNGTGDTFDGAMHLVCMRNICGF